MQKKLGKILSFFLCFSLIFQQLGFAQVAGELSSSGYLSQLGRSVAIDKFRPVHLRSISYDSLNNNFKLLLDKGDLKDQTSADYENVSKKLLEYFFIGLTLPNDSFWVNLRPDAKDNIIDDYLAMTDIGKIMLEADLQLKKDTSSFTSPQTPEGKQYWNKLYQKAGEIFGSENISIPTLTRPWIVPDEIIIRETADSAYVYKATLKILLEQDYLKNSAAYNFKDERQKQLNEYSSQLIRELIIPKLTKEVNTSKRYASLRQVYYSLILAQWFKARNQGKDSQYARLINRRDLANFSSKESWLKTTYFQAYQRSFKDGEYNIKEPVSTPFGQTIRSYFSGGMELMRPVAFALFGETKPASSPVATIVTASPIVARDSDIVMNVQVTPGGIQVVSSPVPSTPQADSGGAFISLEQILGERDTPLPPGDLGKTDAALILGYIKARREREKIAQAFITIIEAFDKGGVPPGVYMGRILDPLAQTVDPLRYALDFIRTNGPQAVVSLYGIMVKEQISQEYIKSIFHDLSTTEDTVKRIGDLLHTGAAVLLAGLIKSLSVLGEDDDQVKRVLVSLIKAPKPEEAIKAGVQLARVYQEKGIRGRYLASLMYGLFGRAQYKRAAAIFMDPSVADEIIALTRAFENAGIEGKDIDPILQWASVSKNPRTKIAELARPGCIAALHSLITTYSELYGEDTRWIDSQYFLGTVVIHDDSRGAADLFAQLARILYNLGAVPFVVDTTSANIVKACREPGTVSKPVHRLYDALMTAGVGNVGIIETLSCLSGQPNPQEWVDSFINFSGPRVLAQVMAALTSARVDQVSISRTITSVLQAPNVQELLYNLQDAFNSGALITMIGNFQRVQDMRRAYGGEPFDFMAILPLLARQKNIAELAGYFGRLPDALIEAGLSNYTDAIMSGLRWGAYLGNVKLFVDGDAARSLAEFVRLLGETGFNPDDVRSTVISSLLEYSERPGEVAGNLSGLVRALRAAGVSEEFIYHVLFAVIASEDPAQQAKDLAASGTPELTFAFINALTRAGAAGRYVSNVVTVLMKRHDSKATLEYLLQPGRAEELLRFLHVFEGAERVTFGQLERGLASSIQSHTAFFLSLPVDYENRFSTEEIATVLFIDEYVQSDKFNDNFRRRTEDINADLYAEYSADPEMVKIRHALAKENYEVLRTLPLERIVQAFIRNNQNAIISQHADLILEYDESKGVVPDMVPVAAKIQHAQVTRQTLLEVLGKIYNSQTITQDALESAVRSNLCRFWRTEDDSELIIPAAFDVLLSAYRGSAQDDHLLANYVTHSFLTAVVRYATIGGEAKDQEKGPQGPNAFHEIDLSLLPPEKRGTRTVDANVSLAHFGEDAIPFYARKRTVLLAGHTLAGHVQRLIEWQFHERQIKQNIYQVLQWIRSGSIAQDELKNALLFLADQLNQLQTRCGLNPEYFKTVYGALFAVVTDALSPGQARSALLGVNIGPMLDDKLKDTVVIETPQRNGDSERRVAHPWIAGRMSIFDYLGHESGVRQGTFDSQDVSSVRLENNRVVSSASSPVNIVVPLVEDHAAEGSVTRKDVEAIAGQDLSASPTSISPIHGPGGIDFRTLPIVAQAVNNLSLSPVRMPLSRLESINLDKEWDQAQKMIEAGITPSADRIREYVQASCLRESLDQKRVVSFIADILRAEEDSCSSTEPTLKDILVVLESGSSNQELKVIFTGSQP